MTIPMLIALSLSFLALIASIVALIVALRSSDRSLRKLLTVHSTQFSELALEMDAINTRLKTMSSRINVAKASAAAAERATTTTDPEAEKDRWQRETNLRIARGDFFNRR